MYEIAKYECIYVTKKIYSILTEVKAPQGILAVIEKQNQGPEENIDLNQEIIIALDGIQDPRKSRNNIKNSR